MLTKLAHLSYPKSKFAIVALLSVNVIFYALTDTLTSTLDALVWLILLIMFELEANQNLSVLTPKQLHTIRNLLIVIIAGVFISYVSSSEWLDVSNALLWFALIALLELEIRRPTWVAKYQQLYWYATILMFTGLIAMVFAWALNSDWLDAYDAMLWITAFAMIEVDIFQFLKIKHL